MNKIAIILGTRPEIIKLSPIIRLLQIQKKDFFIIHTNQHFDSQMDEVFFKELLLPEPKHNLNIHGGGHGEMTGRMLIELEKILLSEKPDWVLVEGDTNTVLAGSLAATKLGIKVGHVEAGLRSYDRTMPEETNRVLADHVSDLLFCPTEKQATILSSEGIQKSKIFVTGNTIVDAVQQGSSIAHGVEQYKKYLSTPFYLLTLHRPSNVDVKETLLRVVSTLSEIATSENKIIYFPVHPRTHQALEEFGITLPSNFRAKPPFGYFEMLFLEKNASMIFTDSGGIQEEACILQTPCITIRENTERPETIEVGGNALSGTSEEGIQNAFAKMSSVPRTWQCPYGSGTASQQILSLLS